MIWLTKQLIDYRLQLYFKGNFVLNLYYNIDVALLAVTLCQENPLKVKLLRVVTHPALPDSPETLQKSNI